MACLWQGDLRLNDSKIVSDIQLLASDPGDHRVVIVPGSLNFLSYVDCDQIPFYLAAGPVLRVETAQYETQDWFSSALLDSPTLQEQAAAVDDSFVSNFEPRQRSVGILVQVAAPDFNLKRQFGNTRVTELLFFAQSQRDDAATKFPTPPPSSPHNTVDDGYSSDDADGRDGEEGDCALYALPLSSDLLYRPAMYESLPEPAEGEAWFLPSTEQVEQIKLESRKRERISDLFDGLADRQALARKKRKQSISGTFCLPDETAHGEHMSRIKVEPVEQPYRSLHHKSTEHTQKGLANATIGRPKPSSRSSSVSSIDIRAIGRKPVVEPKRSSLCLAAEVDGPEEVSLESRNKTTVSRTVMAGMRLYGFQQRRKIKTEADVEQSVGTHTAETIGDEDDMEYKVIYHQVYKGTAFAFRRSIAQQPLQPALVRDVVDKLLGLFCVEPS